MPNVPRHLLTLALGLAVAVSACGRAEHAGITPDIRRELDAGRHAVEGWIAIERAGGIPDDEAVIGLGYVERLRLGFGSPFRLVESALRDPRLSEPVRRQVAWALLARTLSGESYEIDGIALDRAGVGSINNWPGLGRHHLRIIESAVAEAQDPRAGELAVRLAYRIAAMEGSLPAHATGVATRTAALVRDRELARADVARLLRSAEVVQGDPLRAIARWRSERWLRVEEPALTALPESVEREALELTSRLTQSLRALGPRIGDVTAHRPTEPDVNASLLTREVAQRLAEIADSTNMPRVAPISIATRTYRNELLNQPWVTEDERARRELFTEIGTEERFVAQYAQLVRRSPHDAVPSLAAVWAAVALRPFAQEPVWFPGFGGPTNSELVERFGLASMRFDDDVPADWRPYYRASFDRALLDMQRVLPALDLRGLAVRFGNARRGEQTLAMHDPKVRELILPPGSSAGTVAHEVAHDLDWQMALRRYRVRGDYASDRASRGGNSTDRLAVRVRSLGPEAASLENGVSDRAHAHAQRPAENFARAIDWFVTTALAAQGRTNGYLSSIQDDQLTGYGTVRAPDVTGRAGDALINILDDVAPLYPQTRDEYLKAYGTRRTMLSIDLVRSIYELDLPEPTAALAAISPAGNSTLNAAFDSIRSARTRAFTAVDAWICRAPGQARESQLEQARRRLIADAAAARARGVALDYARSINGEPGARWVARRMYGGPWPAQEMDAGMEEVLNELIAGARSVAALEVQQPVLSFELLTRPDYCSTLAIFGLSPRPGA